MIPTPMQACPKCGARDIHRSRAKSKFEHWRKHLTGKSPFRCRACGRRWWGVDPGPVFTEAELEQAARALAPEPPNLKGTALAPTRSSVPEIDLSEIDVMVAVDENPPQQAEPERRHRRRRKRP